MQWLVILNFVTGVGVDAVVGDIELCDRSWCWSGW